LLLDPAGPTHRVKPRDDNCWNQSSIIIRRVCHGSVA